MKENYWKPPLAFALGLIIALAFCLVKLPTIPNTSAPNLQILALPYLLTNMLIVRSERFKKFGLPFLVLGTLMILGINIIDGDHFWMIFQFLFVVLAITIMVNYEYKEMSKNKKHVFWLVTAILSELALIKFSINGWGKIVLAILAIAWPLSITLLEYIRQKRNQHSLFAQDDDGNDKKTTHNQNSGNHENFSTS